MVRAPCCEKAGLKRGPSAQEEDDILIDYINKNGHGSWRSLPKHAEGSSKRLPASSSTRHMAQWESARLEAEARLSIESLGLSLLTPPNKDSRVTMKDDPGIRKPSSPSETEDSSDTILQFFDFHGHDDMSFLEA
ncbi:hypothetical protein L1987_58964 [Smallanthus sonchifolius]|uniref:Uncharacterized protein n=1 Tax=Smallanthus sonchifolius TaxID=185202 RepID=A0ACB9D3W9_9ASTR|nr:hypothetical protein L1987_58964 [Smallanthus sonchifolius]